MQADRRQFLAAACAALFSGGRLYGAEGRTVRLRYRTQADRIARVLPRGLKPADDPVVEVQASAELVLFKVAVRSGDRDALLAVRGWTSDERRLRVAREALSLPVFPGEIELAEGALTVSVDGIRILEVEWVSDASKPRAPQLPTLVYHTMAGPTWDAAATASAAAIMRMTDVPTDFEAGALTALRFPEASVDHPVAEFPVAELLWASVEATPAEPSLETETVAELPGEDRLLPLRYARPVTEEKPWRPDGWPAENSALALDEASLARYREREELTLRPAQMVELTMMCSQEAHAALLPPGCNPLGRPMLKFLGIRSDGGDWARGPFEEGWLLAFTLVAGRPAWYAVSHIVTPGADEIFGRETFGYPTQRGDVRVTVTPMEFALSIGRGGSDLFAGSGMFRGFSTGTTLLSLAVVALQGEPRTGRGRLVYQGWHYQGRKNGVDAGTIRTSLGGDWADLEPVRIAGASVLDGAGIQRSPGEVLMEIEDAGPWLRRRNDGRLPWERDAQGAVSS